MLVGILLSAVLSGILVEPYWNLNAYELGDMITCRDNISRTILEFKSIRDVFRRVPYHILVEPYWNLNVFIVVSIEPDVTILVEPYWNLNPFTLPNRPTFFWILVEPYWNLNPFPASFAENPY